MSHLQVQTAVPAIPLDRELVEQAAWFIRLRWLAGWMILVGVAVGRWGWRLPIGWSAFIVGLVVLLYNGAFHLGTQRIRATGPATSRLTGLIHLQILLDLVALTGLLHWTGGVVSPLRSFFVFQAFLSAMLLKGTGAYLQAGLAVGLVMGLAGLERIGWFPPPPGFPWSGENQPALAVLAEVVFFAATQFVAVFLGQAMAGALRLKEERLVLIQHDLSEAYQRLEELENEKAQFILTLTHELRAPVATIQSLLGAMAFALGEELSARAKDLLGRANRRVMALLHLVNDLLDVAKERHKFGTMEPRPVDLGKVLRNVGEAFQGRAEEKQMTLELEGLETDVVVLGDPEGLERLFGNLVSNAINYTNPGGQVRVRLSVAPDPAPGQVVVSVQDTGIGIPEESRRRLFEEFYRAPNAKKMLEHGTGLGLTICQRIVEEHQGRIEVESEEHVGSTFTVTLPLGPGGLGADSN